MPDYKKIDAPIEEWLILSSGLYYRPNSCGYTGIRDEAGRYTKEYAHKIASHDPENVTAVHEGDAEEFLPVAYNDLVVKHLKNQRDNTRQELKALRDEYNKMKEELLRVRFHIGNAQFDIGNNLDPSGELEMAMRKDVSDG